MKFIKNSFLLLILILYATPKVVAQNNPYKINDKAYNYLLKCYKTKEEHKALSIADTMFYVSGKVRDVKAQCMALMVKCDYYYKREDIPNLKRSLNIIYNFSRKTPYTRYYFHSWSMLINYYLRHREYNTVLSELQQFQKKAYELNDDYAIGISFVKLGDTYSVQGQYDLAITQYQKGIDYYLEREDTKKQAVEMYLKMSTNYFCKQDYHKSIECANYYYKNWEMKAESGDAFLIIACNYYCLNNVAAGDKYTDLYLKWANTYSKHDFGDFYQKLLMYEHNMAHKNYKQALRYADGMGDSVNIYKYKATAYASMGDYANAYNCQNRYTESLRKQYDDKLNKTISEYTAFFENEKLKSEKDVLALKNSSLQVKQLQSAQQMLQLDRQRKGLELSNVHLELNNKNLKLLNQYQEMLKQKAETERLREKARSSDIISQKNRSIATLLALVLAIITISSFVYILLRRKVEQQLKREKVAAEQAREEAERADRLKTLFLQNMSHEIRTPLNAIVGFSSIMAEQAEELDEKTKADYIGLISNNTDQLTTLINDILDLSSLESGYYKVNYEDVDLNDLCSQAIESVKGREKEGVALRFDAPYDSLTIRTDHVRTSQVITNFLTNACKYTDEGNITLTYERQDENVVISVTDTGRGIDIANADKIFNRFEKLDSFVQGTGIGLNICLRIAQLLHGEVKLDTSYKEGSRFLFIIPRENEEPRAF
jgi:signal transduction histidine kinase